MTYDITFVPKAPQQSWEEALAAHRSRVGQNSAEDGSMQVMQPRFDHVADAIVACDERFERIDGRGFVEVCDRATRIQLHMFANKVALTVPVPDCHDTARELVQRLMEVAEIVQTGTGFHGYDPQLGESFPGALDVAERAAAEMVRIRHRIDRAIDDTFHGGDR